ncbi:hypothetical protein BKA69DRAFT_1173694 [Paraphysoderma sedebokerense]|nr:hypothetical protein BKA69DRAFT_1173694 [Paraphysoderma sedebokerense]
MTVGGDEATQKVKKKRRPRKKPAQSDPQCRQIKLTLQRASTLDPGETQGSVLFKTIKWYELVQTQTILCRYCDHLITPKLEETVKLLLHDLYRFQSRQFKLNPIKAKSKKRYFTGLKEIAKLLKRRKNRVKAVIMAKNINPNEADIREQLQFIQRECRANSIPIIYSLTRRQIANILRPSSSPNVISSSAPTSEKHKAGKYKSRGPKRSVLVSALAIVDPSGSEINYQNALSVVETLRQEFSDQFSMSAVSTLQHSSSGFQVNPRLENPIWIACYWGYDIQVVKSCVINGWDINQIDCIYGYTPFAAAIFNCHETLCLDMLEEYHKRMDLSLKSFAGESIFWLSCFKGLANLTEKLLELVPMLVNTTNAAKLTPLMVACREGHGGCVKAILDWARTEHNGMLQPDRNLDWNAKDLNGYSALSWCCVNGDLTNFVSLMEYIRLALSSEPSADVERKNDVEIVAAVDDFLRSLILEERDQQQKSLAILATEKCHLHILKYLVDFTSTKPQPSPTSSTSYNSKSASLSTSTASKRLTSSKSFKSPKASEVSAQQSTPNLTYLLSRDSQKKSPIHYAIRNGDVEIVKYLVWNIKIPLSQVNSNDSENGETNSHEAMLSHSEILESVKWIESTVDEAVKKDDNMWVSCVGDEHHNASVRTKVDLASSKIEVESELSDDESESESESDDSSDDSDESSDSSDTSSSDSEDSSDSSSNSSESDTSSDSDDSDTDSDSASDTSIQITSSTKSPTSLSYSSSPNQPSTSQAETTKSTSLMIKLNGTQQPASMSKRSVGTSNTQSPSTSSVSSSPQSSGQDSRKNVSLLRIRRILLRWINGNTEPVELRMGKWKKMKWNEAKKNKKLFGA